MAASRAARTPPFDRRLAEELPRLVGILTVLLMFGMLEIAIRADWISEFVVPPPSRIVAAFARVIEEEDIIRRFLVTAGEALGAGVLLAAVGVPLGLLLFSRPAARGAFEVWVAAFAAAPLVLAYPLFLVIFGRNASTIIALGFLAGLPPVILKTLEGLSAIRPVLLAVGRSLKLTRGQMFRQIMFPAALPTIFVGVRLGLIFTLINVVGVEFLINFGGLGPLINELAERYDLPGTYAAICFVVLVSIVFFVALERIERWFRTA